MLALLDPGEGALVPTPSYPVHHYGVLIAGGVPSFYPVGEGFDPVAEVRRALDAASGASRPKLLVLNFPHNPTTAVCEARTLRDLFALAEANDLRVVSDIAYADLCFDGYAAPSLLGVPEARTRSVEFGTLSKGRSMAGWRVGFCVGNSELVDALKGLKRYMDYGMFKPIQRAAAAALADDAYVTELVATYQHRRDALCAALEAAGWPAPKPRATMFVWTRLPAGVGVSSLVFARQLLEQVGVAVAPGVTFGAAGEGFIRFGLIESEPRLREAAARIGDFLKRAV